MKYVYCLVGVNLVLRNWAIGIQNLEKGKSQLLLANIFNNYNIIIINNLDLHDNDQLTKVRCWFNSIACKGGLNMFCPEILLALVYFKIGLRLTHMLNKGLILMRYSIYQELLRINFIYLCLIFIIHTLLNEVWNVFLLYWCCFWIEAFIKWSE